MRTAAICPTCATYTNALCVIYNGENLSNINVSSLDNLEDIIININDNLVPVHGNGAPTNSAVYIGQLYIDDTTSTIYFADGTGGGSGDWVEILTELSPIPASGIDDVLAVGQSLTAARNINVATQSLIVRSTTYPTGLLGINNAPGVAYIGDNSSSVNGTVINVNDPGENITILANNWATINGDNIAVSVDGVNADASGNIALSKYKVYTAVISQSSTNPPTVDYTLENTLSGTPTLAYASVGRYQINLTFEFTNNKTVVFITPGFIGTNFTVGWERNSSSLITIHVRDSAGNYVDSLLNKATVEVRVYN